MCDHTAIINRVSKSTNKGVNVTDDDRQYEALLTPHAYGLVLAQVARRDAVKLPADGTPVLSPEGPLFVTDSSCSCVFHSSHRLPCCHIFAHRQMSGKSSFDATLADKRWTAGYSLEPTSAVNTVRVSETVSTPQVALTAHQKYRQIWCQKLSQFNVADRMGNAQSLHQQQDQHSQQSLRHQHSQQSLRHQHSQQSLRHQHSQQSLRHQHSQQSLRHQHSQQSLRFPRRLAPQAPTFRD